MRLYRNPDPQHLKNLECGSQTSPELHYFERLICHSRENLRDNNDFKHMLGLDDDLRVVGFDPGKRTEALDAKLLLRFVWFSDTHIRQRELKLGSKFFSHSLDFLISSVEHDPVQEDFHWAVYFSQIEATNRLHKALLPEGVDFMIHTGDGIDTGSMEELYQFIYISDQLDIPWLNLVGNHDVTIFGNYMARLGWGHDPGVVFYPVGNPGDFIWMHRREREISGFDRYLLATPARSARSPSVSPARTGQKLVPTSLHGFDLQLAQESETWGYQVPPRDFDYDQAGDYAADLRGIAVPVRLIALNSSQKDKLGAMGSIIAAQRGWLERTLLPPGEGINLVFVHHRPEEFDQDTQALLMGPDDKTLVVFSGHKHQHRLSPPAGPRGHYELNTGSVLEYPQIGRLIELRGEPGGPVWLISRALWSSPMAIREEMEEMRSAKEDIRGVPKEILDACKGDKRNAKMENPADAVVCGHKGAYDNYLTNRKKIWRFWERPQPLDEMWDAANVIIQIK